MFDETLGVFRISCQFLENSHHLALYHRVSIQQLDQQINNPVIEIHQFIFEQQMDQLDTTLHQNGTALSEARS